MADEPRSNDKLRKRREAFLTKAAEYTPLVAVQSGDATFVVSTSGEKVGRSLFVGGTRGEMGTLARAVKVLRTLFGETAVSGRTFVDVGANIGTSTVTALCSYPFGKAVACEPEPSNFRLLRLNVTLNGLDEKVQSLLVAASNVVGTAELVLSKTNSGGHRVLSGQTERRPGADKLLQVEKVTIDSLAERGIVDPDQVGLLWIDAQGHEGHVLAGATALVERGVPIVAEFHPTMLARADGKRALERTIAKNYTHFVDLRRVSLRATSPRFDLLPASGIREFARQWTTKGGGPRFTDILVLKRPPGARWRPFTSTGRRVETPVETPRDSEH